MRLWITCICLLVVLEDVWSASTEKGCESAEIMKCLTSISQSADKKKLYFPDTQDKLREYCKLLMSGLDCANELIEKCASEAEKEVYHNLTYDMVGMNVDLCTEGSELSVRFLKHVGCYKGLSDRFRGCSERYIGNIFVVRGLSQEEQMKMTCCTVHEYSRCMRNVVEGRCEEEAEQLVEDTVLRALTTSFSYCNQLGDIPTSDCLRRFSASKGHATGTLDDSSGSRRLVSTNNVLIFVGFLLVLS